MHIVQTFWDLARHIRAGESKRQEQYDDPHPGNSTVPCHHGDTVRASQWGQIKIA